MSVMSAMGQKQTCAAHKPMSALPPNADNWPLGQGTARHIALRSITLDCAGLL